MKTVQILTVMSLAAAGFAVDAMSAADNSGDNVSASFSRIVETKHEPRYMPSYKTSLESHGTTNDGQRNSDYQIALETCNASASELKKNCIIAIKTHFGQ